MAAISGYAATFNSTATIGDHFIERLHPECFNRAIREKTDVRCLLDHDTGRVLGRTKSGTLQLRVDRVGLYFNVDIDDSTPDGKTALALVGRRDLSGCSFGFRVTKQEWDESDDMPVRTILDLDLYEVSIVAFPAYDDTVAALVREAGNRSSSVERAKAAMRLRGIPV